MLEARWKNGEKNFAFEDTSYRQVFPCLSEVVYNYHYLKDLSNHCAPSEIQPLSWALSELFYLIGIFR